MLVTVVEVDMRDGDVDSRQHLADRRQGHVTEKVSDVDDGRRKRSPAELVVAVTVTVADLLVVSVAAVVAVAVVFVVAVVAVRLPAVSVVVVVVICRRSPEAGGDNSRSHLRCHSGADGGDGSSGLDGFRGSESLSREYGARGQCDGQSGL